MKLNKTTILGWVATLVLAMATSAGAEPRIFHSAADDGAAPTEVPTLPLDSDVSLFLYVDGDGIDSQPGWACVDGAGSEICGGTFVLEAQVDFDLVDFIPDPGADLVWDLDTKRLRMNFMDVIDPIAGPKRLGELIVDSSNAGSLDLTGRTFVSADVSERAMDPGVVAVPEPGGVLALALGTVGLFVRARKRSGAERTSPLFATSAQCHSVE